MSYFNPLSTATFIAKMRRFKSLCVASIITITALSLQSQIATGHDVYRSLGKDIRGDGHIPECSDARVLRKIERKFAWADRNTWSKIAHRDEKRSIDDIRNIQQRYRLEHTKSLIAHRHCTGKADISNGHSKTIYYVIEEHMGFASLSWRVNYCIADYDRWKVHGANCKSLK